VNRFPSWRLSPAMVVALIALFVALGGSGYAAAHLNKSPTAAAKRKPKPPAHADAAQDTALIKKQASKLRGPQGPTGPQGLTGPPGPTGPAGSALGFARVAPNGTLDTTHSSSNITASMVTRTSGSFCFKGMPFTPKVAVGSVDLDYASGFVVQVNLLDPTNTCGPGAQVQAQIYNQDGGLNTTGGGLYIALY
jgi:hypothetical protein